MSIEAENNDKAVVLSEEVEFLEALLLLPDLPEGAVGLILDRRDIVRASIQTSEGGKPSDSAEEGYPMPEGVEEGETLAAQGSEPYDADDDLGPLAEEDLDVEGGP